MGSSRPARRPCSRIGVEMHSKDRLAQILRDSGLDKLADRAAEGQYHDYLSPLPLPSTALYLDLLSADTPAATALIARHKEGGFDASAEEAAEWGRSAEAQTLFREIKEA